MPLVNQPLNSENTFLIICQSNILIKDLLISQCPIIVFPKPDRHSTTATLLLWIPGVPQKKTRMNGQMHIFSCTVSPGFVLMHSQGESVVLHMYSMLQLPALVAYTTLSFTVSGWLEWHESERKVGICFRIWLNYSGPVALPCMGKPKIHIR